MLFLLFFSVGLTSLDEVGSHQSGHVTIDVITDQPTISIHAFSDEDDEEDEESSAAKRARYEEVD